jgi:hypothetical protein
MLLVEVEDRLWELAPPVLQQFFFGSELDQLFSEICFDVGFDLGGFFNRA